MYFYSPTFLFLFLPIVVLVVLASGKRIKNPFILFASLFFYAWGEQEYILVLLGYILVNYTGGIYISSRKGQGWMGAKTILTLVVIFNILGLVIFRYANMLADLANSVGFEIDPANIRPAPIGISFFSFQCISYAVDVYRGRVEAQKNPLRLGLYISLFPQLIAGPIVRYSEIKDQLGYQPIKFADFRVGIIRFIEGLAKKVILADSLAVYVDQIYATSPENLPVWSTWLGAWFFAVQIYFDFSGYSDMAIGIGRMFGYRFPENFRFPSVALTIRQFWTKWHISLGTFFRDYLYGPLGARKYGKFRNALNLMIVFAVTGLWHGSDWTFLIWGVLNGLLVVFETYWLNNVWKAKTKALRMLYSISILSIGAILFRATDIGYAWEYYQRLFGFMEAGMPVAFVTPFWTLESICLFIISSLLFYPVIPYFRNKWEAFVKGNNHKVLLTQGYHIASALTYVALLITCFVFIASKTHNPFIYFQF